jgi:nucleotidyltransferase/DNA polymerase involved in DNA repair
MTFKKTILHMDMDCFYAAIEIRDNPKLKGKPVIVGADPKGRGVVSACNYDARKFGLHSAMPIGRARRLCPHGVFLSVNMSKYVEVSKEVMAILDRFSDRVEQISVDEAFMDLTGTQKLLGPAYAVARKIKVAIKKELKLVASIGIAPNKFVAKIASDYGKPDGLVIVEPRGIKSFLHPLPISRLWGVGKQTGKTLTRLGINTIGDLFGFPLEGLSAKLGKNMAEHLKALASGKDDREVDPDEEIKSISHEHTFQKDVSDKAKLRTILLDLTDKVMRRLRKKRMKCRTVFMTFRPTDFKRHSRSRTLSTPTDQTAAVFKQVESILEKETFYRQRVRLIGMGVSNLASSDDISQLDLFKKEKDDKQLKADRIQDEIVKKYGKDAIKRGSLL